MNNASCLSLPVSLCACVGLIFAAAPASADDANRADADGWYSLFNGKDLTGWKVSEDNPDTFRVVDGEIIAHGPVAHLYYVGPVNNAKFKNFEWKCEILTKPRANSGMYFHTQYQRLSWPKRGIEVQVNSTHPDPRKTGSIYRLRDIMNRSPAKDDEWFTQHVIVNGRHIVVKVNDKVVNEYVQPENLKRESGWEKNVLSSGTFALQGHDPESEVHYRKVLVKPLP
ncbi:MAG: DUF1080 domain-containing protein [Pirellulales bacterium]